MADATFTKHAGANPGQPLYEAAGLAWLAEGGARVPKVVEATRTRIVTERIDEAAPTAEAARKLGAMLAHLHAMSRELATDTRGAGTVAAMQVGRQRNQEGRIAVPSSKARAPSLAMAASARRWISRIPTGRA